jgi:hypothetical protein
VDETQGRLALTEHVRRIYERARQFDHSVTEEATVQRVVEVLRAHGQPAGISDEVLELLAEMRRSEAEGDEE